MKTITDLGDSGDMSGILSTHLEYLLNRLCEALNTDKIEAHRLTNTVTIVHNCYKIVLEIKSVEDVI